MYINCKTYYSFLYGTFSTAQLVAAAADKGVGALALTNINSTYDTWEFVKLCREAGIKPIAGVEIRNGNQFCYLLLACNDNGLAWIHRFLSCHLVEKKPFPAANDGTFFDHPTDGFVVYVLSGRPPADLLDNERLGVRPSEVNKLFGSEWKKHEEKFVICQPVTVQDKEYFYVHCLLRAIDQNKLLSMLQKEECCDRDETFLSLAQLLQHFKQYPSLVTNTYKLMDACNIELDFSTDKTKQIYGGSKKDDRILLEKLATAGLHRRYGKKNKAAADRLKSELQTIFSMGFTAYFLINHDVVQYAQAQGYYHVGRGSGANSIVAYCLGITDVDPLELNLYFERFLNPERTSPPDFDIDFSWTDRDDVMDYILKRYGHERVALLGSCPTFKWDGATRQLGKVYGLPDEEIKTLQRSTTVPDDIARKILKYGRLILGFP